MPTPVIALYKPLPGKEAALKSLLQMHHDVLLEEGLATNMHPYVVRSSDGTFLEIFEWRDEEAVKAAHSNPAVLALWDAFGKACEFRKLSDLPEANDVFPHFELP